MQRCADCDVELVEALPLEADRGDFAPICGVMAVEEAECLAAALGNAGIESWIDNELAPFLAVGLPSAAAPIRILVREADLQRGREVLTAVIRSRADVRDRNRPTAPAAATLGRRFGWIALVLTAIALTSHPAAEGNFGPLSAWIAWAALAIAVLGWLGRTDPEHPVPMRRTATYFAVGAIAASCGALFIEYSLSALMEDEPARQFLVVGPVEETLKAGLPLLLLCCLRGWRARRLEWLVAAAASGTGFGIAENLLLCLAVNPQESQTSVGLTALRSTSMLGHLLTAAFVGFCVGGGRDVEDRAARFAAALVLASLAHASWNAVALSRHPEWLLLLMVVELGLLAFGLRAMTRRLVRADAAAAP